MQDVHAVERGLPVIALIGRPNVGKSTLFNRLTRTRDALVADFPGVTRDRQYGFGRAGDRPYIVVDTGGMIEGSDGIDALVHRQSMRAVEESDLAFLLVDGREGLMPGDEAIARILRRAGRPVRLLVNKAEGREPASISAEFF